MVRVGALLIGTAVVLGGCTTTSTAPPDGPSEVGLAAITLHPDSDLGTIDQRTGERVAVGTEAAQVEVGLHFAQEDHAGPALLEFSGLDVEGDCVVQATLDIHLEPAPTSTFVAAYPVRPGAWPEHVADHARLGRQILLDRRPRGLFTRVGSHLTADVTDLVQTWLRGGPFPSQGATVAAGTPLLLAIQPESATSPNIYRLAMSEASDAAPTLSVRPCAPGGRG
jgi:hypothetical protein